MDLPTSGALREVDLMNAGYVRRVRRESPPLLSDAEPDASSIEIPTDSSHRREIVGAGKSHAGVSA
jgi:hypothetical protein